MSGEALFDYVAIPGATPPSFVLTPETPPAGRVRAHVFDSYSIVLDLPPDEAGLRALRSGAFWKGLRRRRRRFEEAHGPWDFRVCTTPDEVAAVLPRVRSLFAERWSGRHTSLPWHTVEGFAAAATAMVELARRDEFAVAVLEGDDRLLAFSCLLLQAPWCYAWQHATTPAEHLRPYSLGTHLDVETFRWLATARPAVRHYDFMLGDDAYKRDWESWRRPVYRRFEQPATPRGALRLLVAVVGHRARRALRTRPGLHAGVQRLWFALARARDLDRAPARLGQPAC